MKKLTSTNAMKKNIRVFTKASIILFFLFIGIINSEAQTVKPINLKEFEAILNKKGDSIYVYNFFATWCKPCVKELPHFVKFANDSSKTNLKFTFINLDQIENLDGIVIPFVKKKKITQEIYLLNNSNYEMWMPRVDRRWGGSIPATLVVNNLTGKRKFIEGEINYKELSELINSTK